MREKLLLFPTINSTWLWGRGGGMEAGAQHRDEARSRLPSPCVQDLSRAHGVFPAIL